jgi:soluble lytic murein transglycosylase-like protein
LTEIVARPPRPRGERRVLQLLACAAGLALVAAGIVVLRPQSAPREPLLRPEAAPVAVRPAVRVRAPSPALAARRLAPLVRAAARGLDRGLFTASPGGVVASAARVARWRPLIARAARGSGFSEHVLEGLVFVESSGRPDVVAGGDVAGAAGLTQIAPTTARRLHLHVNLGKSRRLTRGIHRAELRGHDVRAHQLTVRRRQVDERFAPLKSLRATVRYLEAARRSLHRDDLAFASYHMGTRRLQRAVSSYGSRRPSYAALYFGSSPSRHRAAWRRLAAPGDYYWKLLAAERVMRLYRRDPAALAYEARLQARKSSAEEVLHPRLSTPRFASPTALARAWRRHVLRAIPRDGHRTHLALARSFGQEAHTLGRSRRLYRGLRPQALDVLLYIGRRVHDLSGSHKPLLVTSAVRDTRYQRVLLRVNANAARSYSIHTTGYAFDIARSYASERQAAAFQFVLDRLQSADAIAYIREAAAIHVTVASDAGSKLVLLRRAG